MRSDRVIANRMREMLTMDNVGIKDGFMRALASDVNRVLRDYFEMDGEAQIKVTQTDGGKYEVDLRAVAARIKQFATTMDEKRF